ncbi:MAG: DUF481 domain-containing protein [Deltaproteobacteria bacterium]|nr:DUF481 domain-containing protein [Deltaproteobacteria bacterium]
MKNSTKILIVFLLLTAPLSLRAQASDQLESGRPNEASFENSLDLNKNHLEHSTQLGLIFATGNTQSLSLSGTSETLWRIKRWQNQWELGAFFNRVSSTTNGGPTGTLAHYIYGNYRLDYFFSRYTTVFGGTGGYTDEIKGTDLALQGFVGLSHYLIRRPKILFQLSGGYNYTYENQIEPDPSRQIHSAFLGYQYQHHLKDYLSLSHGTEFLESFNDYQDFRIHSDTELKVKLNKVLSLALGFRLRFDNLPATGFKKLDTLSDLGLVVSLP